MQSLTKLRTSYLAFVAASALGLFIAAAPANAGEDGYVDEPGYAQQANDQAYDNVASEEAMADDEDTAMDDSEAVGDTGTAADDSEDAGDTEVAAGDGEIETVEVTATPPRIERGSMLQPGGKYTMSRTVAFGDLDLTTGEGAAELKNRVREAASEICDSLSAYYPASSADYQPCYREAVGRAMARANSAISKAREYASYQE